MKKLLSVLILGFLLGTGIVMAQAAEPANPETPATPGSEAPATPGGETPETPAAPGGEAAGDQAAGEAQDLVATLQGNPDYSTYVGYLQQAGLLDSLNDECPATLFVPVNSAFSASDPFADLGDDQAQLSAALQGYMVQGDLTSEQLAGMQSVTSLGGTDVSVTAGEGSADTQSVSVGGAALDTAAVTTSNGCTIYPINSLFSQGM